MQRNLMYDLTFKEWMVEFSLDWLYTICRKTGIFGVMRRIKKCHSLPWIVYDMGWQKELADEREGKRWQ